MVELFLAFLGRYARMFIDWYVRNTFLLSSIVVVYGLVLVLAKNNLAKVQKKLEDMLGVRGARSIMERLSEKPLEKDELSVLRAGIFPRIITSPNHVFFRRVTNKSLKKIFAARSR